MKTAIFQQEVNEIDPLVSTLLNEDEFYAVLTKGLIEDLRVTTHCLTPKGSFTFQN